MGNAISLQVAGQGRGQFRCKDVLPIVMTRFNVNRHDARMSQHLATDAAYSAWLTARIDAFRKYCLPSMLNQRLKPAVWIILFDKNIHPLISELLEDLLDHEWIVPFLVGDNWGNEVALETQGVIARRFRNRKLSLVSTVRLDSDDSLHQDFMAASDVAISRLRPDWDDEVKQCINFPYGALRIENGYYVCHLIRHFFTLVEPVRTAGTIYRYNHYKIHNVAHVTDVFTDEPMFMYHRHETNISSSEPGRGLTLMKIDERERLLWMFGLEQQEFSANE